MKLKILSTVVASGLVIASGSAFAAKEPAVAMIIGVEGKALVENAAGNRMVATANMPLAEGYSLMVLEKAKVGVKYVSSSCKMSYSENTLLAVAEASQCAKGQKIAVGAAGGGGVAAGGTSSGIVGSVSTALGVSAPVAAGVIAAAVVTGAVVIKKISDNNSSNSSASR